jgi:sortase A
MADIGTDLPQVPGAAGRALAPPGDHAPAVDGHDGTPARAPAGNGQALGGALRFPAGTGSPVLHAVGLGLVLLGVTVLGFVGYLYGLSGVAEARSQATMYQRLSNELAGEVAPLGHTTPGAPVAVLDIPAIGVNDMVVVQGTTPENLTLGPGHLPDTPMPGQAGVSEIFGRRATFGAPFALLPRLRTGDTIKVINGQGTSVYTVAAVGDSTHVINDPAPNRLVLMTASSPLVPAYYTDVDARLTSTVHPGPAASRVISASELPLAGDGGALGLTMAWALALALVSALGTLAVLRWSPWPAYIAVAPVVLAVLWNLYQNLAMALPNVY